MKSRFLWASPYQFLAVHAAFASAGLSVSHEGGIAPVYANGWVGGDLRVWELAEDVEYRGTIPGTRFRDVVAWERIDWSRVAYATPIVLRDDEPLCMPRPGWRQNIRAAERFGLRFSDLTEVQEIRDAILTCFSAREETRGGLSAESLRGLAMELVRREAGYVYAVSDQDGHFVAAAVVLGSEVIVNIRFVGSVAAARRMRAVHFLYERIIYTSFLHGSLIVDLSGLSSPTETDHALCGIARFKLKRSRLIAVFDSL